MECFVVGTWLFIMARVNWCILAPRCARVCVCVGVGGGLMGVVMGGWVAL